MTQEALAERVGISLNYLGAIERKVKTPKLETLVRIINVLEVSAVDVMLDVLCVGRKARCTKLEERLQSLSEKKQENIWNQSCVFYHRDVCWRIFSGI